jgi:hypothetical protein
MKISKEEKKKWYSTHTMGEDVPEKATVTLTEKRLCHLCGVDQSTIKGAVRVLRDHKGHSLGLFGECCIHHIQAALDESLVHIRCETMNLTRLHKCLFAHANWRRGDSNHRLPFDLV